MNITIDKMFEIIRRHKVGLVDAELLGPGVAKAPGTNKLINGTIPKGCPCPFSHKCWLPCPVNGKVQDRDFSCALACVVDLCAEKVEE